MLTLEQLRIAFAAELQDDATFLSLDEIETHIQSAVRSVNLDKPLRAVADLSGDGSSDYALPSTYLKGFSVIDRVETPAGEDPPRYRARDEDWFVYEDPTQVGNEMRLRFRLTTPQVGDTIRLTYTAMYTVNDTTSNLDPYSFEAVLAGSLLKAYTSLAARFSQSQDPTIVADAVNYQSRVQSFLFLRERAQKEYNRRTGLGEPVKAAQYLTEVDITWAHGEDFIWHPRLLR